MPDANIGPVWPDGHPRGFIQLIEEGRARTMLRTLKGKRARLTHDIPTIWMDRIPIDMQDHVVGVPPTWLIFL